MGIFTQHPGQVASMRVEGENGWKGFCGRGCQCYERGGWLADKMRRACRNGARVLGTTCRGPEGVIGFCYMPFAESYLRQTDLHSWQPGSDLQGVSRVSAQAAPTS